MADILSIAISGLKASQSALTVTGHNITNANTEGYSRQVLNQSANSPQFKGGVWVGSGVGIDSVTRVYDKFLTEQLWRDTSSFNSFETLATNAGQIDSLLADSGTGIQPGLERMFGALQSVVDDPSSLPARAVMLSESQGLLDRFALISSRMNDQNKTLNGQLDVMASEITTIAKGIAELNEQIQFASASAQGVKPNDLLDRRDMLVKDLAELIAVTVTEQDDSVWNISIGNGQALVTGNEYNTFYAAAGTADPSRFELFMQTGRGVQEVTDAITGGQMGGMLEFRSTILDPVQNNLGRLALVINQTFNEQHKMGIDYNGRLGENYFTDINAPEKVYNRVLGDSANARPNDRVISVHIEDAGALTASDYELEFPGPDDYTYRIKRLSDGELISTNALSGAFPDSISIDGFEVRFEAGSFKAGDSFLIMPTRYEAGELEMNLTRPEQIAVASAVVSDAAIGNRGNASITQGEVYDIGTAYFAADGEMTPPLLIRFTSPTTYDVLDNTDPGNPVPLFPPLMNQTFVPGISNSILPGDTGQTAFTSFGGALAPQATYQAPAPAALVNSVNGFAAERFTISYTDPLTGKVSTQPLVSTPANASAKEIAAALNKRTGIEASARTTVELSDFTSDSNGFMSVGFSVNGVVLTDTLGPNQTKYADGYPEDVPDPMTPDFLADRINSNYDFQKMGIVAQSDGEKLTIIALNGEDLNLEVNGDLGDGFSVGNGQDIVLTETGEAPFLALNEFDGYNFSEGGPYTYEFDVPGQGTFSIELSEDYATGADMLNGIRGELERAGFSFSGNLDVAISERGTISFQPRITMNATGPNGSSKLTMGGQLKVIADPGFSISVAPPGNNLFPEQPQAEPVHFGFSVNIDGVPQVGDTFTVGSNSDGISDSRNGVALGKLQSQDTVNGNTSYSESYAMLVEEVGSITSRANINRDSTEILLNNSQNAVTSLSGVNLDEEAAALIRYELAYNANAQVIQVARSIFDTLINTFR